MDVRQQREGSGDVEWCAIGRCANDDGAGGRDDHSGVVGGGASDKCVHPIQPCGFRCRECDSGRLELWAPVLQRGGPRVRYGHTEDDMGGGEQRGVSSGAVDGTSRGERGECGKPVRELQSWVQHRRGWGERRGEEQRSRDWSGECDGGGVECWSKDGKRVGTCWGEWVWRDDVGVGEWDCMQGGGWGVQDARCCGDGACRRRECDDIGEHGWSREQRDGEEQHWRERSGECDGSGIERWRVTM
mmetsp:Transcript_11382/g.26508  ORF Transcript_11382/g.26508 Transcript_11382/m.26508 type:complete len:244 (-) Transcript_11382:661-1392(-)